MPSYCALIPVVTGVVGRGLARVIAVCATLSKERGEALCFPGTAENFHALDQGVDVTLLARAAA